MRAREFINEDRVGSIQRDAADAIPALYIVPELQNQDIYKQYRMGVAFAAARAVDQGLIKAPYHASEYGENMVLVADTPEERETLEMAFKMMGITNYKMVTTEESLETNDVGKVSPVAKIKRNKYGV